MSFWSKLCVYLINLTLFCNGSTENSKKELVESIIQKVFNLTNQSFKYINSAERDEKLKMIEHQLKKSAESLGSRADKYIKLIVDGLKIFANNQSQTHFLEMTPASSTLRNRKNYNVNKVDITRRLFQKISKITEIGDEESSNDKEKMIENIRKKIYDAGKQRDMNFDKIKKYTELITRGMDIIMKQMTGDASKRPTQTITDLIHASTESNLQEYDENTKDNEERKESQIENFNKLEYDHPGEMVIHKEELTAANYSCDVVFRKTCSEIRSLNEFVCKDKQITLPLSKICNGVTDCSDGSDEDDCINQAIEHLQRATGIVSRIDILRECNKSDNNILLLKQNTVLNDIMQRQIRFLNQSRDINLNLLELGDGFEFKRTLNKVANVINTLSIALDNSLCMRFTIKNRLENARKSIIFNTDTTRGKVLLKHCTCNGSSCADINCVEACTRVCWHKNHLGKWICQAVDKNTSVSIDMVCDGKFDCYDETDETACNTGSTNGKFEANEMFDIVLKLIINKIGVTDNSEIKNKLSTLGNTILQLQNAVKKPKIEERLIKDIRDKLFALLGLIYADTLEKAYTIEELEDTHVFLLTVNKRVIAALKKTHTGNGRIIPEHGCYCRRGHCTAISCTPSCNRACAMEPKLTKYWCKDSNNSVSVNLDAVCNGTPNCPHKDDEAKCITNVCRKHHLILLRHHIRDVGERQKGTSLGEALLLWKTKVMSTLNIAEKKQRPTPASLRNVVAGMLHDLVMVYASLDSRNSTPSNNRKSFKEFYKVSQRLIEGLKSCAN